MINTARKLMIRPGQISSLLWKVKLVMFKGCDGLWREKREAGKVTAPLDVEECQIYRGDRDE